MSETPLTGPAVAATSQRIIAAVLIFTGCYFASSLIITLICSMFIAFVLDRGVNFTERLRFPRWLGSILMVVLAIAVMSLVGFFLYGRVAEFLEDIPVLGSRIQEIANQIFKHLEELVQKTEALQPRSSTPLPTVRVESDSLWTTYIFRGIGSIYAVSLTVMFIPFLVFFMLTSKNQLMSVTLNLFPAEQRRTADRVIRGISQMGREYLLGNLLVAMLSAVLLLAVFLWVGVRYALLFAPISAILNMIPYIGVAIALLPPLLLLLLDPGNVGAAPFVKITVAVVVVHFLAVNLLTPKLVGHRLRLNALALTVAMMFWGWLWGAIGLVLAVPITAAIKSVCDNVESLKPVGDFLGEA